MAKRLKSLYLLRPGKSAECNVMPLIFNAATPVGGVSTTMTSSGSNVPDNLKNYGVSEWISVIT